MIKSYIPYILFLYLELVGSICLRSKYIRLYYRINYIYKVYKRKYT